MMRRVLASSSGFTYIAVLLMVVVTGIVTARATLVWKTAMQREKEAELISRGMQIQEAMRRWYKVKVVNGVVVYPKIRPPNLPELKSLLKDPDTAGNVRYLRPYCLVDPMTGEEWEPFKWEGKIVGVRSTSERETIKKGNFPFGLRLEDFEGKKKYRDWVFVYNRIAIPGATGGTKLNLQESDMGTRPPDDSTDKKPVSDPPPAENESFHP